MLVTKEGKDANAAWTKWEAELFQKDYFRAASAVGGEFLENLDAELAKRMYAQTPAKGINIRVIVNSGDGAKFREEATKAAGAMKGEVCLLDLFACLLLCSLFLVFASTTIVFPSISEQYHESGNLLHIEPIR